MPAAKDGRVTEDLWPMAYTPVTLTIEAARCVIRLDKWAEFETIIAETIRVVPESRAVSIWAEDVEPDGFERVLICAEVVSPPVPFHVGSEGDPRESQLDHWVRASFADDVWPHFLPMVVRGYAADEG